MSTATLLEAIPISPRRIAYNPEQRLLLRDIAWEDYLKISEVLEQPSIKLTYAQGTLEIVTTSYQHELLKGVIGDLLKAICLELELDFISSGETTFQRAGLSCGFESDDSFYFTNLEALRRRGQIDLERDAAPDLVIEIDISNPSLNKFPLFAALQIREVWRWHAGQLTVYVLAGQEYEESAESHWLPGVAVAALNELLDDQQVLPAYAWHRKVRAYARQCQQDQINPPA